MITGSNPQEIIHVKQHLHHLFSTKDLGRLHYFLGLEVSYTTEGIVLSQKKFTTNLLKDSGLNISTATSTPFALELQIRT